MKYIKEYNGGDSFYKRINLSDIEKYGNSIRISDKEVGEITKSTDINFNRYRGYDVESEYLTFVYNEGTSYIYKFEDDWFMVSYTNVGDRKRIFYICDQIDGLIKFLNDRP